MRGMPKEISALLQRVQKKNGTAPGLSHSCTSLFLRSAEAQAAANESPEIGVRSRRASRALDTCCFDCALMTPAPSACVFTLLFLLGDSSKVQ